MPQLDRFSFISQIFWFLVIFFGFYILLLRFILPDIARILKTRRVIVDELIKEQQDLEIEATKIRESHKRILVNWGIFLNNYIMKVNTTCEDICFQQEVYAILSKDICDFNELFIETLVSIQIKNSILISIVK